MKLFSANLVVFAVCALWLQQDVLASNTDNNNAEEEVVGDNLVSGLKVAYRAYQQCEKVRLGDLFTCLKLRALRFADRVLRSDSVPLIEGISIVRSFPDRDRNGRRLKLEPLTEVNEENLPEDTQERQTKLDDLLVERLGRFFQTRSIHFDMPKFVDEVKQLLAGDNYVEVEGRKKKHHMGALLLLGGMMKGTMLALGMKGLALLAGKALIIAKIALVLSAIVGLGKLVGGGGAEEKTTYEIIKHPHVSHAHTYSSSYVDGGHGHFDSSGHGHEHYKRSIQIPEAAMYPHLLAYRGQKQQQNTQQS
ncbi:hypothetical protein C0J52_16947 [Blattella germanica]|nr:hypothetical protein C0J52_16947 [Blattella germanica]